MADMQATDSLLQTVPIAAAPRYRLLTLGSQGDLLPFLHLAQGLRRLGRRVDLIGAPMHRAATQAAGLPFSAWASEADELAILTDPRLFNPRRSLEALFARYGEHLQAQVDALGQAEPAEVVMAHPLAVPAALLARAQGRARFVVSACLAPSNLRSCADPLLVGELPIPAWVPQVWRRALWRWVDRHFVDPHVLPALNAAQARLGLAPVQCFLPHLQQAPDAILTLFPDWFAPTPTDWPPNLLSHGFPLQEEAQTMLEPRLQDFLARHPRPWVCTPGTANWQAGRFFASAATALQQLGRPGLFLTRRPEQLPAQLPDSIAWFPHAPLRSLLPQAAGLMHHGGIGSSAEGLKAGIPQFVTPFAFDQFDNATRLQRLGVADVLPATRLKPRALARRLLALEARLSRDAEPLQRTRAALDQPLDAAALLQRLERQLQLGQ